jgi:hypothetical protein
MLVVAQAQPLAAVAVAALLQLLFLSSRSWSPSAYQRPF